jgi:hypothetical protein
MAFVNNISIRWARAQTLSINQSISATLFEPGDRAFQQYDSPENLLHRLQNALP